MLMRQQMAHGWSKVGPELACFSTAADGIQANCVQHPVQQRYIRNCCGSPKVTPRSVCVAVASSFAEQHFRQVCGIRPLECSMAACMALSMGARRLMAVHANHTSTPASISTGGGLVLAAHLYVSEGRNDAVIQQLQVKTRAACPVSLCCGPRVSSGTASSVSSHPLPVSSAQPLPSSCQPSPAPPFRSSLST